MKRRTLILIALVLFGILGSFAQTTTTTIANDTPIKYVSALPTTCSPTQKTQTLVYKYSSPGPGLYRCSATNTFVIVGPSTLAWSNLTGSPPSGALDFAALSSNVNHGVVWTPTVEYFDGYWSAWVKPVYPNLLGYFISDGSGGQHNALLGVQTGTSTFTFTGNVFDGTTLWTLGTCDTIPLGDWVNVEFINDSGTNLYVRIDGIYTFYGKLTSGGVWTSAFTGTRKTNGGGSDGTLFVGGSFHNNFPGYVARVQGFEGAVGTLPTLPGDVPTFYNGYIGSTRASFTADYSIPGTRLFTDHGAGTGGVIHHGVFSRYTAEGPPYADFPTWVAGEPTASTTVPIAPATPAGALVFDSFSRVNSLNLFDERATLGTTEAGSLGVKTWTTAHPTVTNGGAGIFYGHAVIYSDQIAYAYVTTDRNDVDIRVTKSSSPWVSTGVLARFKNADNYYVVTASDTTIAFTFREGGVTTFPATAAAPSGWTVLSVVMTGTTLRVFTSVDGITFTLAATKTVVDDALAVKHGIAPGATVDRYDNFTILPIPVDTTPPSVPTGLTATAISDTEIQLSTFQTSTDSGYGIVTGYEYRKDGGVAVDMGMTTPWIVSGLTASTSYDFEVRAYDDSGNRSGWSSVVTRSTLAPPTPLIDAVGSSATFAGGLRKLRTAYGGAILRVRRASDNVEQDFSPTGTSLDWTAVIAFKGASTLTVVKLYDQSGNGYDEVQATNSKQPALDTTNREIDFDGTDDYLSAAGVDLSATNKATVFAVVKNSNTFADTSYVEHSASVDANNGLQIRSSSFNAYAKQGSGAATNENTHVNTQSVYELHTGLFNRTVALTAQARMYLNGVDSAFNTVGTDMASAVFGNTTLYIGARAGTSLFLSGSMKEVAIFPSALNNTDRGVAETNINATYLIY